MNTLSPLLDPQHRPARNGAIFERRNPPDHSVATELLRVTMQTTRRQLPF